MAFSFLYLAVRALLGALLRSRRGLHVKDIELLVLRRFARTAPGSIFWRASVNTTISPEAAAIASFRPAAFPRDSALCIKCICPRFAYRLRISLVESLEPSETTMISLRRW